MTVEITTELPINQASNLAKNNTTVFPKREAKKLAIQDLANGFKQWRIWLMLAYQDIQLRYRRSLLGPFWITLSMAITVYSMGYLYSHLFHIDIQHYFPYLVGGMLSWTLISTTMSDLVDTFSTAEGMIKQIKLPYSIYIHRVVARNIIMFFHNIIVIIPVILIFHETAKINLCTLSLIFTLMLLYINAVNYGLILAILGARYRDISQLIKSLITVIFFLTPVMWNPIVLPASKRFVVLLNPFYSFVELIRSPLLGTLPSFSNLVVALIVTLIGFSISFQLFARYRARIVYWL